MLKAICSRCDGITIADSSLKVQQNSGEGEYTMVDTRDRSDRSGMRSPLTDVKGKRMIPDIRTLSTRYLMPVFAVLLALAIRLLLLPIASIDMETFLLPWYSAIQEAGAWHSLAGDFYNYTPAYIYLLNLASLFKGVDPITSVKWISILFEFSAAFAVYQMVQLRFPTGKQPWVGFYGVLFLPTVIIDGSYWGQCDIIYTSFLLWSLYFVLREKDFLGLVCFSIALVFKLQALLLAPVFLVLFLHKRIPWYWFAGIPVVFSLSLVPAWMAGRPIADLLLTYQEQFGTYHVLTMNAPSLSALLYFLDSSAYDLLFWLLLLLTIAIIAIYLWLRWRKYPSLKNSAICLDAAFFAVILPFLLPKMHDRYFFVGGLFLCVLIVFEWDALTPAIILQTTQLFSFLPFLTGGTALWVILSAAINLIVILLLVDLFPRVMGSRIETSPNADMDVMFNQL